MPERIMYIMYIMYNDTGGILGIYADGDIMVCVNVAASEAYKLSMRETHASPVRG